MKSTVDENTGEFPGTRLGEVGAGATEVVPAVRFAGEVVHRDVSRDLGQVREEMVAEPDAVEHDHSGEVVGGVPIGQVPGHAHGEPATCGVAGQDHPARQGLVVSGRVRAGVQRRSVTGEQIRDRPVRAGQHQRITVDVEDVPRQRRRHDNAQRLFCQVGGGGAVEPRRGHEAVLQIDDAGGLVGVGEVPIGGHLDVTDLQRRALDPHVAAQRGPHRAGEELHCAGVEVVDGGADVVEQLGDALHGLQPGRLHGGCAHDDRGVGRPEVGLDTRHERRRFDSRRGDCVIAGVLSGLSGRRCVVGRIGLLDRTLTRGGVRRGCGRLVDVRFRDRVVRALWSSGRVVGWGLRFTGG